MRASPCDIGACSARASGGGPVAPVSVAASAPAWWRAGATGAALLFALGAPFSIFVAQLGVFAALLLLVLRPAVAFGPLLHRPALGAALGLYLLVQLASILYSQHPLRSVICLRGDWPVLFLPLFLAVLQVPRARRLGIRAILFSSALAGVLGLWQHVSGGDPLGKTVLESDGMGRFHAVGSLGGHLTYGGVMLCAFLGALAHLWTRPRSTWPLLLPAVAACGAGLVTSYARSALFGAAVGALVVVVSAAVLECSGRRGRRRWLRMLIPAAVLLGAGALIVLLTPGLRARLSELGALAQDPRVRLWTTALRIFEDFPLFGAGLGAFKSHFAAYRVPGAYMATGHPHNDALNVLVHSGLAGLVAWIGLWVAVLREARSIPERVPTASGDGTGLTARVLLWALVAGFLAAGLGQCYFTDEEPAGVFWFLVAWGLTAAAQSPETGGQGRGRSNEAHPEPDRGRSDGSDPGPGRGRSDEAHPEPRQGVRDGRALERRVKRALLSLASGLFLPRARRLAPPAGPPPLCEMKRILLVRQDNRLGNLVLITPFLKALRQAAPQAQITLLVGSRFAPVLEGAPWLDTMMRMHKRALIRRPWTYPAHLAAIRRCRCDLAVDLSNPDTHSFYNTFVPVVAGAPWRVGFDHPRSRAALNGLVPPPARECHYSLAPLLLLSALGVQPQVHPASLPQPAAGPDAAHAAQETQETQQAHAGQEARETHAAHAAQEARAAQETQEGHAAQEAQEARAARPEAGGQPSKRTPSPADSRARPVLVIHPGGRGAKRWPCEGFEAVARALAATDRYHLRIIGGPGERDILRRLSEALPAADSRCITTIGGLRAALEASALYLGCDAGPLHVASALSVPCVAVFITSHPLRYAPLGSRSVTLLLGERSLARAQHEAFPADASFPLSASDSAVILQPDAEFADRLASARPRMVFAKPDLTLSEQADLVITQIKRILEESRARAQDRTPVAGVPRTGRGPDAPGA